MKPEALFERLLNGFDEIKDDLSHIKETQAINGVLINSTFNQATKTNGRVTALEDTVRLLSRTVEMLAITSTQNSGILKTNQDKLELQEKKGDLLGREIDELKKQNNNNVQITIAKLSKREKIIVGLITTIIPFLMTLIINLL